MAKTPKKLVHWALEVSMSDVGSPFSEASSEADSTCSLQYINSQLIAHGFTHNPGLTLDGTSKDSADRVVKCLLAMLSQRIDDMSRTEDLSTKIRTLSYDHERLMSMYRITTEKAANAERETTLHKSRLASVSRNLQSSENAHKQTVAELQRTRTTLQAVRATHTAEIKKLEREKDRVLDRWTKLADQQLKAGAGASSLRFSNAEVVEAPDVSLRGKGKGFLEVAAEQALEARDALFHENQRLRTLLLSTANEIQRLLHMSRSMSSPDSPDEPPIITNVDLFPMAPADAPHTKFASLTGELKEAIEKLALPGTSQAKSASHSTRETKSKEKEVERAAQDQREIGRLTSVVETLRKQLKESQQQSETYSVQIQELFDKLASEEHAAKEIEPSIDLLTLDEERQRLQRRSEGLEEDRRKFTEAAVKLGKEKAALETERIRFLEEKRAWQVDVMLSHLPPTPHPRPPSPVVVEPPPIVKAIVSEQHKSPKKITRSSPRKAKVAGISVGGGKKRVVPASPKAKSRDRVTNISKVIPSFETEVIPIPPSPSFVTMPAFKTTFDVPSGPVLTQPPAMAPAFVLPPPSPAAQLPPKEALLSTALSIPPSSMIPARSSSSSHINQPAAKAANTKPLGSTILSVTDGQSTTAAAPAPAIPSTPSQRPFPMAKPLASRMIHAYSPVKPSPLSRILLLKSPDSPPVPTMPPLSEEDESSSDVSPTPEEATRLPSSRAQLPTFSLAAELGIPEEDEDENPLLDKPARGENPYSRPKSRMEHPSTAMFTGKTKSSVTSRSHAGAPRERESSRISKSKAVTGTLATNSRVASGGAIAKTTKPTVRTSAAAAPVATTKIATKAGVSKAGPRRVPIDSAEAAPAPRTWKS